MTTVWTEHEIRDLAGQFHRAVPLKKDKHAKAKNVLNDATINTPLDGREFNVALAVLAGHPDLTEKVGAGVIAVDVRMALYGTRCFHVTRVDGTSTDFSYLKCLQPPTPRQEVQAACRNGIRADIALKKKLHLVTGGVCELTGMPIDEDNSHVHHSPPMFDVLVDGWADSEGGYDRLAGLLEHGDNTYGNDFPEEIRASWLTWHTHRARMQVVHRSANLHIEAARRAIRAAG